MSPVRLRPWPVGPDPSDPRIVPGRSARPLPAATIASNRTSSRVPWPVHLETDVPCTVADLVLRLDGAEGRGQATLSDATHDSRTAGPGVLFCAIRGATTDGHEHAAAAVDRGASALLVDHWLDELEVAQVRVPDTRAATGPAASVVHDDPSHELLVVGVTGTNGKTTTSYLLEHAFAAAGLGSGVIGTIEARIHGERVPGVRTTPEGTDLQRLLRRMHDRGVDAVAMEASSHGLSLHRVDGIRFAVAVFLNLTQDHLDFHADMEDYFRAKARLFTPALSRRGVVCVEDEWGRRLARESGVPVTTLARTGTHGDVVPDWRIENLEVGPAGSIFDLVARDGDTHHVTTSLVGDVNAVNAAAAWLAAVTAGVGPDEATAGIAACPGVPGRMQVVPGSDDAGRPTVLVDYAHTPDAVEQAIRITRGLTSGRVVVVLGCGGDRDRGKRAPMGAATTRADVAVLTSDNPRSEDPAIILDAMEAGAREALAAGASSEVLREPDREAAIALAIGRAGEGDIVLVAGKGHETGQAFADRTVPFDDVEVAGRLLADAGGQAGRANDRTAAS